MRIELDLDAVLLRAFLKRYPQATDASINVFKDRVGYTLENQAKKEAPHVSGNLKRQMWYYRGAKGATLYSYAEYSKYVHGAPYYKNPRKRKETPFFTRAIRSKRDFIKEESRQILKRVLK